MEEPKKISDLEYSKVETDTSGAINVGDNLPFGYYNPETEGKLTWICGQDAEDKICSVFTYDNGDFKDKRAQYLESVEKAIVIRDELVRNGWKKLVPPKVTFSQAGGEKPLNRRQKRYLARKVKRMQKNNPFDK